MRGQDLNLRPSGYEPDELPGCSTPRQGCNADEFCQRLMGKDIVEREGFKTGLIEDLAATYSSMA